MEMGKMEQEDKGLRVEVDPPINNPTEWIRNLFKLYPLTSLFRDFYKWIKL